VRRAPAATRSFPARRHGFPGSSSSVLCCGVGGATPAAPASRNIPIWKRSGLGRPPRPGSRRRRVHGPASRLLWEDVLPGEISRRSLEDLVFHLKLPITAPQLGEFLLLLTGQPLGVASFIGVGLADPVLQARPADPQVLRQLDERLVALARQLD